jgi:hypothetical protein
MKMLSSFVVFNTGPPPAPSLSPVRTAIKFFALQLLRKILSKK